MNDESALLKAAKRFEQDALTAIFDIYASRIYQFVLRLCYDPVDSDYIVGDVFAQLLEKLAAGQGPLTNLRSYLYQIAYHLVVDRARHKHQLVPLEFVIDKPAKLLDKSIPVEIEEWMRMDACRTVLNNDLSDIQRHVIILRFMEGFSLGETAAIIGKNVNNTKVIQSRGMARLRKALNGKV